MTRNIASIISIFIAVSLTTVLVQLSLAPSPIFAASLIATVPVVCFFVSIVVCLVWFQKSSND